MLPVGIAAVALPSVVKAETSLFDLAGKCEDNYIVDGIYMIQREWLGIGVVTIMGVDDNSVWTKLHESVIPHNDFGSADFNGMQWTFTDDYTHVHIGPDEARAFKHDMIGGSDITLFSVRDGSFIDIGTMETNNG